MTRSRFGVIALLLLPAFAQSAEPDPYTAPATSGAPVVAREPASQGAAPIAGPEAGYGRSPMGMPDYGPEYFGGALRGPWSQSPYGRPLPGGPGYFQPTTREGASAAFSEAGAENRSVEAPARGGPEGYGAEPFPPWGPADPGYYGGRPGWSYGPGYYEGEPRVPFGPGSYEGEPGTGYVSGPELRIQRNTTADAYVVRIYTRQDIDPAAVNVQQRGRRLLIRSSQDHQTTYRNDQAPGYRTYSYSYSSGSMSRRFTLPRDADVSAMKRRDEQGMVTLTFPRNHRE